MSDMQNAYAGALLAPSWRALALAVAQARRRSNRTVMAAHAAGATPAHYDGRYSHNQYYTPHGVQVGAVPGRPYVSMAGRALLLFRWRLVPPHGPNFVVVGAARRGVRAGAAAVLHHPVGRWRPYYYANDTYYTCRPAAGLRGRGAARPSTAVRARIAAAAAPAPER